MRNKATGFTLVEILIAVVILAILAALAIPAYRNTMEQARGNEAITNLNVIHMAEKIKRLNTSTYVAGADIATLNTNLDTDMAATFFTGVVVAGNTGTLTTSYRATMTRNGVSGGNGTDYYRYDYTNGNVHLNTGSLATSGAVVKVYEGSSIIYTFTPTNTGREMTWHVFNIDFSAAGAMTLTPIDTYSSVNLDTTPIYP